MLQPVLSSKKKNKKCKLLALQFSWNEKNSLASLFHLSAGSLETALKDFIFQETYIEPYIWDNLWQTNQ